MFKQFQKEVENLNGEIITLKEGFTIYKEENEKKLNNIFKYSITTKLEQCEIIAWLKEPNSPEERQKLLNSLQLEIINEAFEVANANNLENIVSELEILGASVPLAADHV